jgi:hypothetical protein
VEKNNKTGGGEERGTLSTCAHWKNFRDEYVQKQIKKALFHRWWSKVPET